jgi:hypothetical protein
LGQASLRLPGGGPFTPKQLTVISPEQLSDALQRLDPRERELLSLSLWRRVPDEALARMYACEPGEVARRRARAIERLADELQVQRGEDLGAVLKALLEPETWAATEPMPGREFDLGPTISPDAGADEGDEAPAEQGPIELRPLPEAAPAEQGPIEPELAPAAAPVAAPPGAGPNGDGPEPMEVPGEPVLEMLSARERGGDARGPRTGTFALVGTGIATLLGAAVFVGATQFGDGGSADREGGDGDTRHFTPAAAGPLQAPFASDPRTTSCYSTAYVRRSTVLYREPGGRAHLRITARTEWSSPRVLGVVGQRGDWLGVQAPELRNGEVGWIPRARARVDCVRWSLHADLSERRIYVRKDGQTVRRMRIAIGSPQSSTPLGRFSVTDKLEVADTGSAYGCCVLALTGHQTRLPPDWPGGDRLAVHATTDLASIGQPVSLGCMRASTAHARWLIETIPLGAPIFVRS